MSERRSVLMGVALGIAALAGPIRSQQATPGAAALRFIDLSADSARQIVVDREGGQYLGHPTTVLLEDGLTMIAVYPRGHGSGAIVMKRSTDGGLTWSSRLPTPASWATSKEVPTIHRVVDRAGKKRLILFSGLYPIRMSVSEDDGAAWSELRPIGPFGGIVAMGSVERLKNGDYLALFHDDGRFIREDGKAEKPPVFHVYKTVSADGGLTWTAPEVIARHAEAMLCEPGLVRSPDGRQIAVLLRENSRTFRSFVIFSDDEGRTWTAPRELAATLTGDRHTAKYAPDGRLLVSFRDMGQDSVTKGDWIAWVGRYDDLAQGRDGQYRVRLMDNQDSWDCCYPGVDVLPDRTFVLTTYGHWTAKEQPYVVSVRLRLDDLDRHAQTPAAPPAASGDARLRDWPNLSRYREANRSVAKADVVFMGDSITDSWQQPRFGGFFPGKNYVDRGISGQTTPQMLLRFRADVVNLKPRAVVILAGTNDIAGNTGPMTDEEIEGNLASMAELAVAAGVKVVLASITPVSEYHLANPTAVPQTTARPMARIRAINEWMRGYAAAHGHVYLDYFSAMTDAAGLLRAELSGDDLHPNAAGYAIMAPLAEAAIAAALGSGGR